MEQSRNFGRRKERTRYSGKKKKGMNSASRYNFLGPEGSGSVNLVGCRLFPESVLSTS